MSCKLCSTMVTAVGVFESESAESPGNGLSYGRVTVIGNGWGFCARVVPALAAHWTAGALADAAESAQTSGRPAATCPPILGMVPF